MDLAKDPSARWIFGKIHYAHPTRSTAANDKRFYEVTRDLTSGKLSQQHPPTQNELFLRVLLDTDRHCDSRLPEFSEQ